MRRGQRAIPDPCHAASRRSLMPDVEWGREPLVQIFLNLLEEP